MKKKVVLRFLLIAIILGLFIFFAAKPTGKYTFFEPTSVVSIMPKEPSTNITERLFPFVSLNSFGYYNQQGEIVFAKSQQDEFSICEKYWAQYEEPTYPATNHSSIEVFSPTEKHLFSVPQSGLLHFRNNRIFVLLPSGNEICEYSNDGKLLWTYATNGILTAFDCNDDYVVLGSSDGFIVCLNSDGTEKFHFYPGGSDLQIIYGLSLSSSSEYIAAVCGVNKQRLVLIELTDYHKIVFHEYLQGNLRSLATLFFDKASKYLVFETATGFSILDCKTLSLTHTGIKGKLSNTNLDSSLGLLTILTQENENATLSFFDLHCRQIGSEAFTCTTSSLMQEAEKFYLVLDEKLLTFTVTKQ